MEGFYNQRSFNSDDELMNSYSELAAGGFSASNYYSLSNRILTFNRFYSGMALGYSFIPLVRGDLFLIYDIEGAAFFTMTSLTVNLLENLDFSLGAIMAKDFSSDKISDFKTFDENYVYTVSLVFYF